MDKCRCCIERQPKRLLGRSRLVVLKGLTRLHTRFFLVVAYAYQKLHERSGSFHCIRTPRAGVGLGKFASDISDTRPGRTQIFWMYALQGDRASVDAPIVLKDSKGLVRANNSRTAQKFRFLFLSRSTEVRRGRPEKLTNSRTRRRTGRATLERYLHQQSCPLRSLPPQ